MRQIQTDKHQFNRLSSFSKFSVICCIVNVLLSCHLLCVCMCVVPRVTACTWISIWFDSQNENFAVYCRSTDVLSGKTDRRCRALISNSMHFSLCSFPLGFLTEPEYRLAMTFLTLSGFFALSVLLPLIQTWWITLSNAVSAGKLCHRQVTACGLYTLSMAACVLLMGFGLYKGTGIVVWKRKATEELLRTKGQRVQLVFDIKWRVNRKSSCVHWETVRIISIMWNAIDVHWEA